MRISSTWVTLGIVAVCLAVGGHIRYMHDDYVARNDVFYRSPTEPISASPAMAIVRQHERRNDFTRDVTIYETNANAGTLGEARIIGQDDGNGRWKNVTMCGTGLASGCQTFDPMSDVFSQLVYNDAVRRLNKALAATIAPTNRVPSDRIPDRFR